MRAMQTLYVPLDLLSLELDPGSQEQMIFWYLPLFSTVRGLSCNKVYDDDDDTAYDLKTAGNDHTAAYTFHASSCNLNANFSFSF